ncbi:MAG TPA: serine hydrolase domain-containing protein [Candidatus Saccharimonadales bacterium]|nr:serine hydrolase domain-containing protein [Candidatus Saccharimonadales bacterium]
MAQVANASSSPQIVPTAGQPFIITDDLKQTIRTLVDNGTNAAMVVGLVDANGTQFFGYGKTSNATNATTVNENTLFDLGSITKTFTTTLLADMVSHGEVNLDDPLENYLPATVKVPAYNGSKITLQDLATHSSGLPDYPLIYIQISRHIQTYILITLRKNFMRLYLISHLQQLQVHTFNILIWGWPC